MLTPVFSIAGLGLTANRLTYSDGTSLLSASALTYATSGTNLLVTASGAAVVPLTVKAATSQSANLLSARLSNDTDVFYVGPTGQVYAKNTTTSGTTEPWLDVESQANSTGLVARFKRTGESTLSFKFLGTDTSYIIASSKIRICYNDDVNQRVFDATTGKILFGGADTDELANSPGGFNLGRAYYGVFTITDWSSTTSGTPRVQWIASAIDNTHATRKYRGDFYVWDTAARGVAYQYTDGSRGYWAQKVHTTAPADAALDNGTVCFYDDGAGSLKIKLKDSGGTVRTGTVTLT